MAENPRIIDLPSTNTLNQDDSLIVDSSTNNCRRIETSNLLKQIQTSSELKAEYLSINGNNQMQAPLKMGEQKITGLAKGTAPGDAATLSQAAGGGIFAVEQSKEAAKIDLEQQPLKTITEYQDGMQITFVVKNNSVNNLQVQLNGLGYKAINDVGIGSFIKNATKTIMYNASAKAFEAISDYNAPVQNAGGSLTDFNELLYPMRTMVGITKIKNKPNTNQNGYVETVMVKGATEWFAQRYYTENGEIFMRQKREGTVWTPWRKLITDYEFNQILALAKAGTRNGLFKFTPKKGVVGKNLLDYKSQSLEYYDQFSGYYSSIIGDKISSYANIPPIETSMWFYLVQIFHNIMDYNVVGLGVFVGYLKNPNNPSDISWWVNSGGNSNMDYNVKWDGWKLSTKNPWDN